LKSKWISLSHSLKGNLFSVGAAISVLLSSPAPAFAIDLDLSKYSGTWYEVASLKEGFAGEGQKDCHCTAGLYSLVDESKLTVKTFCVHGSPTGKISGIEGAVSCQGVEGKAGIMEANSCNLRFPSIPFIPPEPYTVLETDYDTYALVEGARDKSFVQIYSRTPNPGKAFINKQINHLEADYGYKKKAIKPTPQDCSQKLMTKMDSMMKSPDMVQMFRNTTSNTIEELLGQEEEDFDGIILQGPRNPVKEVKDLVNLFQMFKQQ